MAAAVIGAFAYVGFGRLTGRFESERALATMYVVTFIGTLAATVLGALLVRAVVGTITR